MHFTTIRTFQKIRNVFKSTHNTISYDFYMVATLGFEPRRIAPLTFGVSAATNYAKSPHFNL